MKVYLIVKGVYDCDCSWEVNLKGFTDGDKAKEYAKLCTDESMRIIEEVKQHNEKYEAELLALNNTVRDLLIENGQKKKPEMIDFQTLPECMRRNVIGDMERAITKTHKYDPEFMETFDQWSYDIQEIEVEMNFAKEIKKWQENEEEPN